MELRVDVVAVLPDTTSKPLNSLTVPVIKGFCERRGIPTVAAERGKKLVKHQLINALSISVLQETIVEVSSY